MIDQRPRFSDRDRGFSLCTKSIFITRFDVVLLIKFLTKGRVSFIVAMLQWFADILIFCNVSVNGIIDFDLLDYMAWEMKCFTGNISFSAV